MFLVAFVERRAALLSSNEKVVGTSEELDAEGLNRELLMTKTQLQASVEDLETARRCGPSESERHVHTTGSLKRAVHRSGLPSVLPLATAHLPSIRGPLCRLETSQKTALALTHNDLGKVDILRRCSSAGLVGLGRPATRPSIPQIREDSPTRSRWAFGCRGS
jgi:hypothetical protein